MLLLRGTSTAFPPGPALVSHNKESGHRRLIFPKNFFEKKDKIPCIICF